MQMSVLKDSQLGFCAGPLQVLLSLAVLLCTMCLHQALQHCILHVSVPSPAARTMHSYELPIGLWHLQLLWVQEHHPIGEKCLCHNQIMYLRTPEQQAVHF